MNSKTKPTDAISPHRVYEGLVSHSRYSPTEHSFNYKLFYLYLDLDHLDMLGDLSGYWSVNKRNLVQYRREDYFPYHTQLDLKQSVQSYIQEQTGLDFQGKVFVLTNLRYWGHCFNPVSYYFCYDQSGELTHILDHVTNTPWKESHVYLHDLSESSSQANNTLSIKVISKSDKQFHVSPFMPMNLHYQSRYQLNESKLLIHMDLSEIPEKDSTHQAKLFSATMNMSGRPLSKSLAKTLPFTYPIQCGKIVLGIYWQALRLWLKKVPVHKHPRGKG